MKPSAARAKGARLERRVASKLGGTRTPLSGAVGGSDVIHDRFRIEVKARKQLPVFVTKAMKQAEDAINIGDTRRPLVVMREDRGREMVCLWLDDFTAILADEKPDRAFRVRELIRSAERSLREAEGLCR